MLAGSLVSHLHVLAFRGYHVDIDVKGLSGKPKDMLNIAVLAVTLKPLIGFVCGVSKI